MPMTYEEKLREEFLNDPVLAGNHGYCNPIFAAKIADFFLQHHIEFVESVRKEIEKTLDLYNAAEVGMDREIAKHILSLPSLTVTNK